MRSVIFAVLAGLCWGVGELCTKSVLHGRQVGPMGLLVVRTAVALPAALLAYGLARYALKSETTGLVPADGPTAAKLFLGSALAAGFGGVLFFYLALATGPVTVAKPIAFTLAPATAVVLGWWLIPGEAMTLRKATAIVMILAGVVLLTTAAPKPAAGG